MSALTPRIGCLLLAISSYACNAHIGLRQKTSKSDHTEETNQTPPEAFSIEIPTGPTNETKPTLSWSAAKGAVSYRVALHDDACSGQLVVADEATTSTWAPSSSLGEGTYHICVTAVADSGSTTDATNNGAAITIKTSPPGEFALAAPGPLSSLTTVTITWSASQDADHYEAFLASDDACANKTTGPVSVASGVLRANVTGVASGTHYACVAAVDAAGNRRLAAARSAATKPGRKITITTGFVLGQPDTASNAANNGGISASTASMAAGGWSDGQRMVMVDSANHRVLIWRSMPSRDGQAADLVLGQPDFQTVTANEGGVSDKSFSSPISVFFDGQHLIVSDYGNNRVLIWNSFPTSPRQPADVVVGQNSMSTNASGTTATTLSSPSGAVAVGNRLYVADDGNNRILVYEPIPTANGAAADFVLGQATLSTGDYNHGGLSDQSIADPSSVFADADHVVVADSANNRVLVWSPPPSSSFAAATLVLGQPDDVTGTTNTGGLDADTMNYPIAAFINDGKLYVAERENNRVLIWDTFPTMTATAATRVIGQPDLQSAAANAGGGVSLDGFDWPQGLFVGSGMVLVPELNNNRMAVLPLDAY